MPPETCLNTLEFEDLTKSKVGGINNLQNQLYDCFYYLGNWKHSFHPKEVMSVNHTGVDTHKHVIQIHFSSPNKAPIR